MLACARVCVDVCLRSRVDSLSFVCKEKPSLHPFT